MSLLAQVLTSVEKVELDDINTKLPQLKTTIQTVKSDTINYIETVYVRYSNRPKHNLLINTCVDTAKSLSSMMESAKVLIQKEIPSQQNKLQADLKELQNLETTLSVVHALLCCNELCLSFTHELDSKNYLKCMEILEQLELKIRLLPADESSDILQEFRRMYESHSLTVYNALKNVFFDNIVIDDYSETDVITLKIKARNEEFEQGLLAMYFDTSDVYQLHDVIKCIWNSLVEVVDHTPTIELSTDDDYNVLKLNGTHKNAKTKSQYKSIFESLKTLFNFLSTNLSYKLEKELSLMEYIGSSIRDNLSELIIKHCLQDTIPSNAEGLQAYISVIQDTNQLEAYLLDINIFAKDTVSLLEYANNIDIHFINKKCQEYLLEAESLMRKGLHEMTVVGDPYSSDKPMGSIDYFLQCSVSKSAIDIINLCEKMLKNVQTASDLFAGRLICTVQNICTKYCIVVPEIHKNLLQTIPQQVALFHNNCMYISFMLLKWDNEYSARLTKITSYCNFVDQVLKLRSVAGDIFSKYVEGQINQLNEIIKHSGLNCVSLEKLAPQTEKSIRQCLRQQELLKTVWHKVLSYTNYNKAMGVILDALCDNIVNTITKFEDISSDVAKQLVEILKLVLTRAPKLFTDPREISIYAKSWYKLSELNFVLNATLLDIHDRWADGKGPLALQFTPMELKQLIRALFQNTDRRSMVLAKIQDHNVANL